jgi:hypothetical protein
MDIRQELEKARGRPVRSAADAEFAAAAAEALAAYLRAEEDALRALGLGNSRQTDESPGDLHGLTLHAAAERVLEDAGVPLHVSEIGKRMKARGWKHPRANPRPDQINHQLAARLPRYKRFVRTRANTFGLAIWRSAPPKPSARPSVGIFSGPGAPVAEAIGDDADEAASAGAWRS